MNKKGVTFFTLINISISIHTYIKKITSLGRSKKQLF